MCRSRSGRSVIAVEEKLFSFSFKLLLITFYSRSFWSQTNLSDTSALLSFDFVHGIILQRENVRVCRVRPVDGVAFDGEPYLSLLAVFVQTRLVD